MESKNAKPLFKSKKAYQPLHHPTSGMRHMDTTDPRARMPGMILPSLRLTKPQGQCLKPYPNPIKPRQDEELEQLLRKYLRYDRYNQEKYNPPVVFRGAKIVTDGTHFNYRTSGSRFRMPSELVKAVTDYKKLKEEEEKLKKKQKRENPDHGGPTIKKSKTDRLSSSSPEEGCCFSP